MIGDAEVKGDLFDEFFNVTDHYNIVPAVTRVAAGRYLGDGFTFNVAGTFNKISKLGDARTEDLVYYAADGGLNYSMRDQIGGPWLDPSLGVGGGYTWVDEVGFGTLNATASVRFWVAENLAINFQSTFYVSRRLVEWLRRQPRLCFRPYRGHQVSGYRSLFAARYAGLTLARGSP